jgi:papain like protease
MARIAKRPPVMKPPTPGQGGNGNQTPGQRGTGRRFSPNQQHLGFTMRGTLVSTSIIPAGVVRPKRKTWAISPNALDQGNTGTCVGHAWKNFLRCAPIQTVVAGPSPWEIYRQAVGNDEWADNDHEKTLPDNSPGMQAGTCVRAGAQVLVKLNRARLFLWAFELEPVIDWVLLKGPMVLGINWYSSMFTPDEKGLIRITPTASIAGGHAVLIRGIDTTRGLCTIENSWGNEWGNSGGAFLQLADLDRLLSEDGEAASAVELKI